MTVRNADWPIRTSYPTGEAKAKYYTGTESFGCTWYCHGRSYEATGWEAPYGRLAWPNANEWPCNTTSPKAGDIVVCNDTAQPYGHVLFIERINADGSLYVTDVNVGGYTPRTIPGYIGATFPRWNNSGTFTIIGFTYNPNTSGGGPGPGPGPGPEPPVATQPIEPEYGPGDQIWLTRVSFSCHYVDSTYINPNTGQHDVYFHPAMKLLINGNVVATSKKGISYGFNIPGEDEGKYTDISWASESPDGVKTNDFQVRLNGDHPNADRFDIIGANPDAPPEYQYTYIEYYLCKPEEYDESLKPDRARIMSKEIYTSYFDGTKWTTFKKE